MSTIRLERLENPNTSNGGIDIDSTGNVGIGKTPAVTLDVDGTVAADAGFYVYNATNDGLGIWYNPGATGVNQLTARVNGSDRLTIDGSGVLNITSTATNGKITIGHANNYLYGDTSNNFIIGTNGSDSVAIDGSGRLLVGTSSNSQVSTLVLSGHSANSGGASVAYFNFGANNPGATTNIGVLRFADSGQQSCAEIAVARDGGTWTSTSSQPSAIKFSTTPNGSTTVTERMRITSAGNITSLLGPYNNTIATGVNLHITSAGTLKRVTSSAKYKTDIETLEDSYADNILNCRPVWYRALGDEENPEYSWYGFLAEEVAEIDPRLVQYREVEITYDEDGNPVSTPLVEPEPEGVSYERFVPHLVNLIKRQQARIETLEAKVAALESTT
jgi:hypothetical protein